jgi:PEP-CTERM motif
MYGLDELVRYSLAAVPDPGTLVLIGTGAAGLGALWRRYVRWRGTRQDPASRDGNSATPPTASSPSSK